MIQPGLCGLGSMVVKGVLSLTQFQQKWIFDIFAGLLFNIFLYWYADCDRWRRKSRKCFRAIRNLSKFRSEASNWETVSQEMKYTWPIKTGPAHGYVVWWHLPGLYEVVPFLERLQGLPVSNCNTLHCQPPSLRWHFLTVFGTMVA